MTLREMVAPEIKQPTINEINIIHRNTDGPPSLTALMGGHRSRSFAQQYANYAAYTRLTVNQLKAIKRAAAPNIPEEWRRRLHVDLAYYRDARRQSLRWILANLETEG